MFTRELSISVSPAELRVERGLRLWRLWSWALRQRRESAVIAARVEAHRDEIIHRYRAWHSHPWQ